MQTQQNFITDRERPLVSFIVTYYNIPSEMLRECLDSILSLSMKEEEREILLIDDGSERSPIEDIKEKDGVITFKFMGGAASPVTQVNSITDIPDGSKWLWKGRIYLNNNGHIYDILGNENHLLQR